MRSAGVENGACLSSSSAIFNSTLDIGSTVCEDQSFQEPQVNIDIFREFQISILLKIFYNPEYRINLHPVQ